MRSNPWVGGLRDELEAKVRRLNEIADPAERFSEPQIQAIVYLFVETIDEERETFLPMLEGWGHALRRIASGKECPSHHCPCIGIAEDGLKSPSGSDTNE
jgi:hypothetical protein